MSEISDMIQRLCPDGVEYRKLGEVCSVVSAPKKIDKGDYQSSGMIPIVDQGKKLVIGYTNDCYATVPKGCYVIFGDHTREIKYVDFDFAQGADGVKILKANNHVDIRYLFHAMTNLTIPSRGYNRHWTIARDLEIPVPPLEVQRKIVEVLDNFSELTAELEARKKQYEYYRDNLLNFSQIAPPNSVKWMKLGDVFDTITDYTAAGSFKSIADNVKYLKKPNSAMLVRTTDLKSNFCKGDFIYIDDKAFQFLWRVNLDAECIVMPNVGNCGEVYYILPQNLPYEKCALAPNAILIKSTCNNNKYLSYILQTNDFQKQLKKITSPVGQSKFNKTEFKKLLIPIPPLSEQERIVSILDRFEALTSDLTSGLPAEIKARQQQYEYYRDQLLTFKRAN